MAYRSVAYRKQVETGGDLRTPVALADGIKKVKEMAAVKADRTYKNGKKRKAVDQTVELVVHLGIDPKHADQMIRGAISLPKGIGKSRTIVAFVEGDLVDAAKEAGAVEAGGDELVKKIQDGWDGLRRCNRPPLDDGEGW